MPTTEIITIGDELLIGQVIDTNSAWIGEQLNGIGLRVHQITSVSDNEKHILTSLKEAIQRSDIIFITGGLGPTKDDITKTALCKFFKTDLRFDEESFRNVQMLFKARGREVTELNRKQAELPSNCKAILNVSGTAPGMWFEELGKIIVSMPGVPHEMKGIMSSFVLPELKKRYVFSPIIHKTILTQGIGESFLSELISDWEDHLPKNIKLAYLPSNGMLRLRLTATGTDEKQLRNEVESQTKKLEKIADEYIFGFENDSLESIIGKLLRENKQTLSTAESCTGGSIAQRITSIPGSSDYYTGSVVAYANGIKENFLNIDPAVIEKNGAVSENVVRLMAENVRINFKTDYSIAATGIAGPSGGSAEKPVGMVWIAVSGPEQTISKLLRLGTIRRSVILEAGNYALNLLRKMLLEKGEINP